MSRVNTLPSSNLRDAPGLFKMLFEIVFSASASREWLRGEGDPRVKAVATAFRRTPEAQRIMTTGFTCSTPGRLCCRSGSNWYCCRNFGQWFCAAQQSGRRQWCLLHIFRYAGSYPWALAKPATWAHLIVCIILDDSRRQATQRIDVVSHLTCAVASVAMLQVRGAFVTWNGQWCLWNIAPQAMITAMPISRMPLSPDAMNIHWLRWIPATSPACRRSVGATVLASLVTSCGTSVSRREDSHLVGVEISMPQSRGSTAWRGNLFFKYFSMFFQMFLHFSKRGKAGRKEGRKDGRKEWTCVQNMENI